jgi:hypothetical protein
MELDNKEFKKATSSKKQIISHAWSECHKFLAQEKTHPKMFIEDLRDFGMYMQLIYKAGEKTGCKLDKSLIDTLDKEIIDGFNSQDFESLIRNLLDSYFDWDYLISDANSLYYKGLNIFPYVYDEESQDWKKYVPVENLKEIQRQIEKTLKKRSKK